MGEDTILFDSVDKFNKTYGFETLHPLVSVFNMKDAPRQPDDRQKIAYGLYAIFLKQGKSCEIRYGRRNYDYQDGTIVSFAPGQVVEVSRADSAQTNPDVFGIVFHPDLIRGTSLGAHIHDYGFFAYSSNEALHLSERERQVILDCFSKIRSELEHPIDRLSRKLVAMNIELLLNYCLRFYERQFITREEANNNVLQKFERFIDEYFDGRLPQEQGLPSVKYFADKVFLSANYFGDLVKKETGKSAQEYIQFKLIERAKDMIAQTDMTMSEIAYSLGFQYPQHFGRLFKKQVGCTPNKYRILSAES